MFIWRTSQLPVQENGLDEDAYALIVSGTGHIIRYNRIFDWWDGIHVGADESDVETSGCDVYGNEVYNCTDDGVETDASNHNVRVFENRFTNCLVGLSAQPVFGGPAYFIRNVVYNWQLKPLTFHQWPTGLIVLHNTVVGADPRGWGGGDWRNALVRNNIIIGGSNAGHSGDPFCLETVGLGADLDFNGWYQAISERYADFNYVFCPTLESFQNDTGMELNGVLLDLDVFIDAEEPPLGSWLGLEGYFPPYEPGSQDLRIVAGSAAVDAGEVLPNINEDFDGVAPDLGAYELGQEIPIYGPDAEAPVGIDELEQDPIPLIVSLAAPNPTQPPATIRYVLVQPATVSIRIYDPSGRLVRTLERGSRKGAGHQTVRWDGTNDAARKIDSGLYFLRVEVDGRARGSKLILIRSVLPGRTIPNLSERQTDRLAEPPDKRCSHPTGRRETIDEVWSGNLLA
jgi:hypothetical protein